ncbi:MAG: hypothetical protein GXO32_01620 [Crenarchaeota archaeon]|nr:hypothetical protein [Thermoproteota archaeon]
MGSFLEIDLTKRGESCVDEPLVKFAIVVTGSELDRYSEIVVKIRSDLLNPEIAAAIMSRRGFSCVLEEADESTVALRCKKVDNPSQ